MDEQRFDNIARRLGGLRTRRAALRTAGFGTAAAFFTALGLEKSTLAQEVGVEDHCLVRRAICQKKKDCCGARRKSQEIVCDDSNAGAGKRCCGKNTASCTDDTDCCALFFCNGQLKCAHV
jgi:hypothetical protein